MEKCRSLNKEERTDQPQPHAGARERERGRETRRWLYARRSVTQARWATAPLPRVATLRTGWPRDAQSRLALLRRKPEINIGCSFRAHWRESLCVFVASVLAHFLLVVGISCFSIAKQHDPSRRSQFCGIVSLACIEYSGSKIISCA